MSTARELTSLVAIFSVLGGVATACLTSNTELSLLSKAALIFAVLIGAAGVGVGFSRLTAAGATLNRWALSLRESGELRARGSLPLEELSNLREALAEVTIRSQRQFVDAAASKQNQDAVMESMIEGVVLLTSHGKIIMFNEAARKIFGVASSPEGRAMQQVIRIPAIHRLVQGVMDGRTSSEQRVIMHGERDVELDVYARFISSEDPQKSAVILVCHDVTNLVRLERIRREFVANVSHELKTPITSIKGSVETLLDGALAQPADAERFVKIIGKHTDRLEALVSDLLTLARLEEDERVGEISRESVDVLEPVRAAIQLCAEKAVQREIHVTAEGTDGIFVLVNPVLVEQAVMNLLDNAIKFSEPGKRIIVRTVESGPDVRIEVTDHGPGIAKDHLPRVFERFYRAEQSRTRRDGGGTGLGLAIVKHIATLHGGRVDVESVVGKGSKFSIVLRRDQSKDMPTVEPHTALTMKL